MKTIAIFSGYALPHLGGIERYVYNLSNRLIEKGYRVIIISSNYDSFPNIEEKNNLINIRIPIHSLFKGRYPIPKKNKEYKELMKRLESYNIDRIIVNTRFHLTTLLGAKFGKKHNIPVYLIEHGSNHLSVNNKLLDFFGKIYEHILTKYVEKFVDYNYGVSKDATNWQKHFNVESDGIWYNSIVRFDKDIKPNKNNKKTTILYAGRILKDKGIEDLIIAYKKIEKKYKDSELIIAGDGNYLEYLKRYESGNIKFLGKVSFDQLIKIYAKANIFVHPSHYPEGLPTCILEAGLMKCAVIATPNGGTKDFLNGKNGIVIESQKELEDSLNKLLTDKTLMNNMGEELNKTVIKNFTWERTTDKILKDMNLEKSKRGFYGKS